METGLPPPHPPLQTGGPETRGVSLPRLEPHAAGARFGSCPSPSGSSPGCLRARARGRGTRRPPPGQAFVRTGRPRSTAREAEGGSAERVGLGPAAELRPTAPGRLRDQSPRGRHEWPRGAPAAPAPWAGGRREAVATGAGLGSGSRPARREWAPASAKGLGMAPSRRSSGAGSESFVSAELEAPRSIRACLSGRARCGFRGAEENEADPDGSVPLPQGGGGVAERPGRRLNHKGGRSIPKCRTFKENVGRSKTKNTPVTLQSGLSFLSATQRTGTRASEAGMKDMEMYPGQKVKGGGGACSGGGIGERQGQREDILYLEGVPNPPPPGEKVWGHRGRAHRG